MTSARVRPLASAFLALSLTAAPDESFSLTEGVVSLDRFGAFEENYALWQFVRDTGWSDRRENPLRAHLSFRYLLQQDRIRQFFFSYTGEFDFYWFEARPSSPVIHRFLNPALHLRWRGSERFSSPQEEGYLDLGLEHRSDGQVVEAKSPGGIQVAQEAYDRHDQPYFDQISRGANYLSLGGRMPQEARGLPLAVEAKIKGYFTQDSTVTWGPRAGLRDRFADYDLVTLRLARRTERWGRFEGQWTVGAKGLKTDSLEVGWQRPEDGGLPVYLRWHHGPMNSLSNYTQSQDALGLGLRFTCPPNP
jgi:hypothetical protein